MNLSMFAGPIIGAIIGYGTNWIAIKMLFRPLKPIKIGKFTLPFTPGIIPKRKNELAKAIGETVGNKLFTTNDIQKMLLSEKVKNGIVQSILNGLQNEDTIKSLLLEMINEKDYAQARENLKLWISQQIRNGLLEAGLGEVIINEGNTVIRNKVKGSMLRMFVTDDLIDSILHPIGKEIEIYLKEHGQEKIIPVVDEKISVFEDKSLKDILNDIEINEEKLTQIVKDIYEKSIFKYSDVILEKLDISGVVETKINDMEVLELERLILSIMKKELGAIVNLGALIGFLLGSLNLVL